MTVKIAPSLLSADFTKLAEQIKMVEEAGADWHHLDVMDGRFVPNITFGPIIVEAVKRIAKLPLDVHLMIVDPEKYIPTFIDSGADWITFHYEAVNDVPAIVSEIRRFNVRPGVSINPETPLNKIVPYLDSIDLVLLMSVHPGFGGQDFIPKTIDKVVELVQLRDNYNYSFLISIDGGVNLDNTKLIVDAGVDVLVAGSSIYGADNPAKVIKRMRDIIEAGL